MIYVIIGQSGSGKTTYVKKHFLSGDLKIFEDITPYTTNGKYYGIGKYGIGIRTEGTDTLSYSAGESIRKQIDKLDKEGKDIVVEGDRINNLATFEFLKKRAGHVFLILLICSLKTSIERLRLSGSKITPSFVKATQTKSKNNFLKYRKYFTGTVVNTNA